MRSIKQILKDKLNFPDSVVNDFLESIEGTEKAIFSKVLTILRKLAQREGKLVKGASKKLLASIEKDVLKIIRESTLIPKVEGFLKNFDEIDRLNKELYEQILSGEVKINSSPQKDFALKTITRSLTNQSVLNANFTNEISKALFEGVTLGMKAKDVEDRLRLHIKGNDKKLGRLRGYVGQVVRDSLNGYDGLVNDIVRDAYQLDGFVYVGGIVKDSRDNCIDLVNGSGRFAGLSVSAGTYRTEDRTEIIRRARKGKNSGYNPQLNEENFAQIRMGYNCLHQVIYIKLSDEQIQKQLIN